NRRIKIIDRCHDQIFSNLVRSNSGTFPVRKRKSRARRCWMQEQHIVGIDHGRVGDFSMRFPNRTAVEIRQCLRARRHVAKASEPDKTVWIVLVPELTDDLHPERFLRLDKFTIEQIDQDITLSRMKRVLPQLDDRAAPNVSDE